MTTQDGITAVGLLTCDEEHGFVIKITDGLGEEVQTFSSLTRTWLELAILFSGRPMHVRYISADGVRRRLTLERESILSLSHWICRAEEDTDDTAAMFFSPKDPDEADRERSEKNSCSASLNRKAAKGGSRSRSAERTRCEGLVEEISCLRKICRDRCISWKHKQLCRGKRGASKRGGKASERIAKNKYQIEKKSSSSREKCSASWRTKMLRVKFPCTAKILTMKGQLHQSEEQLAQAVEKLERQKTKVNCQNVRKEIRTLRDMAVRLASLLERNMNLAETLLKAGITPPSPNSNSNPNSNTNTASPKEKNSSSAERSKGKDRTIFQKLDKYTKDMLHSHVQEKKG